MLPMYKVDGLLVLFRRKAASSCGSPKNGSFKTFITDCHIQPATRFVPSRRSSMVHPSSLIFCRSRCVDYFYHLIIKDKLASIYIKLTHCLKFDIFTRLSFEVRG